MIRILNIIKKLFILFIILWFSYQYLPSKIYTYPKPAAFSGEYFYNPYEMPDKYWLKGNFHAHARAWSGLTNGHQSGAEVENVYKKFNYDIHVVSDYFRINPDVNKDSPLYIPTYEHGSDVNKTHRQILGAEKVDFYDITFQFNTHLKQYLVERLRKSAVVLALNHPGSREGHSAKVLRKISGYDCIEVFNNQKDYTGEWDVALSAGKAVWLMSNDDAHEVEKENNPVGTSWTMLNVDKKETSDVLAALSSGKTYGVQLRDDLDEISHRQHRAVNENALDYIKVENDTVKIKMQKTAEEIRLIGQNGRAKKIVEHTDAIEYPVKKNDTYLRTEVLNKHTRMIFNPVIRYDGINTPQNTLLSKTHWGLTLLFRFSILITDLMLLKVLIINPAVRRNRKKLSLA